MVEPEDQRQVELSLGEGDRALVGLAVGEAQLHLRMARAERLERPGPEDGRRAGEGAEAEAPAPEPRDRPQVGLGGRDVREHLLRVHRQRATGLGQADAAAGPFEERRADVALKVRHLLGDR